MVIMPSGHTEGWPHICSLLNELMLSKQNMHHFSSKKCAQSCNEALGGKNTFKNYAENLLKAANIIC